MVMQHCSMVAKCLDYMKTIIIFDEAYLREYLELDNIQGTYEY